MAASSWWVGWLPPGPKAEHKLIESSAGATLEGKPNQSQRCHILTEQHKQGTFFNSAAASSKVGPSAKCSSFGFDGTFEVLVVRVGKRLAAIVG